MRSAKRSADQTCSGGLTLALSTASNFPGMVVLACGVVFACGLMVSACGKDAPPPAPPPPAAKAPPPAAAGDAGAKPKMVANPDGLSLAERMAKRQAAEAKVAAELAAAEKERLLAYDRTKLPLHRQTFAFILKTRAQYDALARKGPSARADLDKLRGSLGKPIEVAAKKMATIDPKGGNSNVTTDYDVMLNALANDYPAAIAVAFEGDKGPLEEQTAEMDKRTKKVEDWMTELSAAGGGKGKGGKTGKTTGKKKKKK